jgi:hypothetical protein
MRYQVRYAYRDLGQQQEGNTVVVHLRGSAANVILLNPENFLRYRVGQPFSYTGGHYRRSRVRLPIPQNGHWYVVLDLGGIAGRAQAAVDVVTTEESRPQREPERALA